ncbi:MAG: hypothetical protein QXL27_04520 [Candidatus Bathyarchaeia archaeon]
MIPIYLYRRELEKVISVDALVDTGFDGALILSRPLGYYISKHVEPEGFEELDAAGIGIPCDVYVLNVQIGKRWFKVKSHLPRAGDLGTIVGRILLNRIHLCLRGPESMLYLAKPNLHPKTGL